jgi:hypothetical protein
MRSIYNISCRQATTYALNPLVAACSILLSRSLTFALKKAIVLRNSMSGIVRIASHFVRSPLTILSTNSSHTIGLPLFPVSTAPSP